LVDLDRFIDERLAAAPVRRSPVDRQPKPLAAPLPLDRQETAIERAPEPRGWERE
jgi:hypothetical protein